MENYLKCVLMVEIILDIYIGTIFTCLLLLGTTNISIYAMYFCKWLIYSYILCCSL